MVGGHLGVDVHPDDAELDLFDVPQHVAHQQERRLVGPVQVVDDQQQRAVGRKLAQRRRDRFEEAEAAVLGVAGVPLEGLCVVAQPEDEAGELRELPHGHARDPVGRLGMEVAPQRLGEGLERRDRILVTASPQHQRALVLDRAGQRADETRLPDARIAVDEQEAALALADRRPPLAQQDGFTVPPDQRPLVGGGGDAHPVLRCGTGGGAAGRPGGRGLGLLRCREGEGGVLGEDGVFHPRHVLARLDPELVHQRGAQDLKDTERLRLPPGAVERQHALRPQALAHRLLARQRLQLADQRLVTARRHGGVDARLDRRHAQLLETPGLGPCEGLVAHLAVGRAAPEVLRLAQQADRFARSPPGQPSPALRHQVFEGKDVRRVRRDLERVARGAGHDQVLRHTRIAEALAEPRDRRTECDLGSLSVVVAPQGVDQPVDRHDQAAVDQQPRHQRPSLHAAQVDHPAAPGDLERTEDPDRQRGRDVCAIRDRLRITPRHLGTPDLFRCQ